MEKILNEPSRNTELVFNHAGDTYVLSEIKIKGEDQADQVIETKSEKRAVAAMN
jgi:hypothetical protein